MQSQFLSSGSFGDGKWIVPISLCLGSYNRTKNFLLERQVRTVDISELLYSSDSNLSPSKGNDEGKCKEHSWVKVNIEQTGFYRVKYDDKLAAQLRKAIEENCLSETDKFGKHHFRITSLRADTMLCHVLFILLTDHHGMPA